MIFQKKKRYNILLDLSKAIAYLHCHTKEIIHGDIKPDNVMITKFGQVKLCDLGLSKIKQDVQVSMMSTSNVRGTPMYMSPEQLLESKTSSRKTDVYSFGVTMFEVLYEEFVYEADNVEELCISLQNSEIPQKLWRKRQDPGYNLIHQCLQFEPTARPDAMILIEELKALCFLPA